MQERIPGDRVDGEEVDASPNTFGVEKPKVQMQDLEHRRAAETRVSNKGVRVEPAEAKEVLPEPK